MKNISQQKVIKLALTLTGALAIVFLTPGCLSLNYKLLITGSLLLIINTSEYISKVPFITHIFRVATGGLFIFSGVIKSNDPTGFGYKLQEYFEVFTADFVRLFDIKDVKQSGNILIHLCDYFHVHSVELAIIVCVSEVALGFMLLIGWQRTLTLWLLLAQIGFFTFLTFYSACYNKVTGCGCFGDFIKLAPWESFWKDIVLLVAIAILFAGKDNIKPLFSTTMKNLGATSIAIATSVVFPIFCYSFLPVWDFLPFYNGSDVCKGRENGPNYKPAVYQYNMYYKNLKTGEIKEFTDKNAPWADTLNWKYDTLKTSLVSKAQDEAKILTYTFQDMDGNELADSLLRDNGYYFLLIMNKLDQTSKNQKTIQAINSIYNSSRSSGLTFYAVTHDFKEDIEKYKKETKTNFPFLISDDVQLKMMVRSNPGLMLFKGCKMIKKWHYNNLPTFEDIKSEYLSK